MSEYPRVLVVGQNFSVTGGGLTVSNLFRGWPKSHIAVAATPIERLDATVCENHYWLGLLEDYWVWPLSYIERQGKVSGPVTPASGNVVADSVLNHASDSGRRGWLRGFFYRIVGLWGANDLLRRLRLSSSLLEWVKEFKPHVLYTLLGSLNMIRLVSQLVSVTQIPLAIHIMDDWPSVIYQSGLLSPYLRWRTDTEFRALLSQASVRLGISQAMCEAFEARYSQSFLPFHNPVDLAMSISVSKANWNAQSPFRLIYAGSVGPSIRSGLCEIARAVSDLHIEGHDIEFEVYALDLPDDLAFALARLVGVRVCRPVPYQDIPALMAGADLLVIAYNFDPHSAQYVRYSMPTKAVEYMASGTPILVYAPSDLVVSSDARKHGWGYVVSEQNHNSIREALVRLSGDINLRESMGRHARKFAIERYDAQVVRSRFCSTLLDAACRPVSQFSYKQ